MYQVVVLRRDHTQTGMGAKSGLKYEFKIKIEPPAV
jgi:hypothetical protein